MKIMTKFDELVQVWGRDKANEFKTGYLEYVREYFDDDIDLELDAANILARILTDDRAEFAEDFYDYYDVLGLGDGDIDRFASELSKELLS